MNTKGLLQSFSQFFSRYRWIIISLLFIYVVAQQCTISRLRNEIEFLHSKYETYVPYKSDSSAMTVSGADIMYQNPDGEALIIKQHDNLNQTSDSTDSMIGWVIMIILLIVLLFFMLYRFGFLPFSVNVSGKVWQDLNGRVIYTLQIKNGSRKAVNITNPMIEFAKVGDKRKFRMPVADFPLTLQPSTKHIVNVSLQKLIEQNQSLMDYKTIRASVDCNSRVHRTFPLVVRWSRK